MNDLDALLARSRDPGRATERRRFTLARDEAVEKLRSFSLRRPDEYILSLIQASIWGGATAVAIDAHPHRILVAFTGGEALPADALERLFDYLFADRDDPSHRHLVQLAVALNALLQRRPRVLRVESGDGTLEGSIRVDLDGQSGVLRAPALPIQGTYVLAELGSPWLGRLRGEVMTPEQLLIEERCIYTPVPILLNGRAPFGYAQSRQVRLFGVDRQLSFDDGERWGAVGVSGARAGSTGFRIVMGGVWVTSLELRELGEAPLPTWEDSAVGRPLTGVICDDRLRRTADQAGVVLDGRYGEMLSALRPVVDALLEGTARPVEGARSSEADPTSEKDGAAGLREIPLLGARGRMTRAELDALPPDEPLFWVEPAHTAWLAPAADPLTFPHRILVLDPSRAAALSGRGLHRLSSPEDIAFVQRALEEREPPASVERFIEHREGAEVDGKLTLRLHEGPRPAWAHHAAQIPALVRVGGQARWCGGLPMDLPCVSAVIDAHHWRDTPASRAWLASQVEAGAWALLAQPWPAERGGDHARRALAVRVLAAVLRPRFVQREERVLLRASPPPRWGPAASAARSWPLAREIGGGDLNLQDLLALQGTDRVIALEPESPDLSPLEARLGFGHLSRPETPGWICAVGRWGERWRWVEPDAPSHEPPELMVWLAPTVRPSTPPGWTRLPDPAPACGAAYRGDGPPPDDAALAPGLLRLRLRLERITDEGAWDELSRPPLSRAWVQAMARLLRIGLWARRGEAPPEIDGLPLSDARSAVALGGLAAPGAAALTLDELRVAGLPLRLDDDPSVWESLADPEAEDWLIREPVEIPGTTGWLGLRIPFDPTGGALLRIGDEVRALPPLSAPAHGLLLASDPPPEGGLRLLPLALLRLYRRLPDLLRDPDPARREAARCYGIAWACSRREGAPGAALGAALARQIHLTTPTGGRWGTLQAWLGSRDPSRPPLPGGIAPAPSAPPDERGMRARLEAGVEALCPGLRFLISPRSWRRGPPVWSEPPAAVGGAIRILINPEHPLGHSAMLAPGPTREVILLEIARLLVAAAEVDGRHLDLHQLHRHLASGLTGAAPPASRSSQRWVARAAAGVRQEKT